MAVTTRKKPAANELPLTPAQEVPANSPPMGPTLTLIDTALQQYDPINAGLQALRDKYGTVKIKDVNDADGLELARTGVRELTSTRTRLEAKRKELKADSLEYGRRVDAKAKEIEAAIRDIENPLKDEIARIEMEKEAIKRAEETRRIKILTDAGFQLIGQTYQVGNVGAFFDVIMAMDDMTFSKFATNGALEADRLQAEKEQRERELAAFEEKKREMAELETRLAALKAEQEKLQAAPPPPPPAPEQPADIWDAPPPPAYSPLPMEQFGTYRDSIRPAPAPSPMPANPMMPVVAPAGPTTANSATSTAPATAKEVWFRDGWEACKARIIKVFTEDATPRKRAEWVAIFQNIKP